MVVSVFDMSLNAVSIIDLIQPAHYAPKIIMVPGSAVENGQCESQRLQAQMTMKISVCGIDKENHAKQKLPLFRFNL